MRTRSTPGLAVPKRLADQKRTERRRQTIPTCPVCGTVTRNDDFRCRECGSATVVGEFVSQGTGAIPRGHTFALRARDYVLGRSMNADYVIPDEELPNEVLELRHIEPDRFAIAFERGGEVVQVNQEPCVWNYRLEDGDVVQFGAETFVYRLEAAQPDGDTEEIDRLRRTLDRHRMVNRVIQSLFNAEDFHTLCMRALRATLRVTHLDRAVFFLVEDAGDGESFLRQIVACTRETDGRIDETEILRVSQDILGKALENGDTVVVEDTGREIDRSRSVVALELRSLVCIPVIVPRQTLPKDEQDYRPAYCLGMIYADSIDPMGEMPEDCSEFLSLLANTLSFVILQWESSALLTAKAEEAKKSE